MPTNIKKYTGDVNSIFYRSLWERRVMMKLDEWPQILEWSNEEVIIPYRSPLDNKVHKYFPDFLVKIDQGNGSWRKAILEVKPKARLTEPKKPKRKTRRYIGECLEYAKNMAKFDAARAYCADRGWQFMILTEDQIFGKKAK